MLYRLLDSFSYENFIGNRKVILILLGFFGFTVIYCYTGVERVFAQPNPGLYQIATQPPPPEHELNLPLVFRPFEPTETPPPAAPPTKILHCSNPSLGIPDNDETGVTDTITISNTGFIGDLDVRVDINHTWVSDLSILLTHEETGKAIVLIDRPGYPAENNGCREDDIKTILDDDITLPVESECAANPAAISGSFRPENILSTFDNDDIAGNWKITVTDTYPHDVGNLNQWCIAAQIHDTPTIPPIPPSPEPLPEQAIITGVTGQGQALPLDCESRSAIDWAKYYGTTINELEFFYALPVSDNPDLGFVGDVMGVWGQIPPQPYGVHAEPVAEQLREYGLAAYTHHPLTWDDLRAEIAAGKPVITWIVCSNYPGYYVYVVNGIPEYYSSKQGNHSVVSRFEHTVIVTGYSPDSVTYLNGGTINRVSLHQFLESWSVLGNMAITSQP